MCVYIYILPFLHRPFTYILYPHIYHYIYSTILIYTKYMYINSCCCLVAKPCPTLCDPMDCSLPGSSVHGISQARILEWVAIPFFRASSWSRDQTPISWIAGRFFTIEPLGKPYYLCVCVYMCIGEGKGYPLQYSGLENSRDCIWSMGSQRVGHDWVTFTIHIYAHTYTFSHPCMYHCVYALPPHTHHLHTQSLFPARGHVLCSSPHTAAWTRPAALPAPAACPSACRPGTWSLSSHCLAEHWKP